jgi:hypothetical protein
VANTHRAASSSPASANSSRNHGAAGGPQRSRLPDEVAEDRIRAHQRRFVRAIVEYDGVVLEMLNLLANRRDLGEAKLRQTLQGCDAFTVKSSCATRSCRCWSG